jgi:hypothetical protein
MIRHFVAGFTAEARRVHAGDCVFRGRRATIKAAERAEARAETEGDEG